MKIQWINEPDKNEVENFINTFMIHAIGKESIDQKSSDEELINRLHSHFRAGYCWHFAQILKAVFERGEICWAAPFSHIVWHDNETDDYYDIEGKYSGEAMYMIPEKYLESYKNSYKHISEEYDKKYAAKNKKILIDIMKQYCHDNNIEYDNYAEIYFK